MTDKSIGNLFPTKIPGLEFDADIQQALTLYHYGSLSYDTEQTDPTQLPTPSMAKNLQTLKNSIDALDSRGIGSKYTSTEPVSPTDGFIWVNPTISAPIASGVVVALQSTAPSNPVTGTLWVDSTNGSSLVLKVYDGTTWKSVSV